MKDFNFKISMGSLSGILLGVSLPNFSFWWCAWFALVPLLIALKGLSIREAFNVGLLSGIIYFFVVINWLFFVLKSFTLMNWIECFFIFSLLLLYLALYLALFSIIISNFTKNLVILLLVAPSSWVLLEYMRGRFLTGFPWGFIGYSQFEQLYIVQIADIFGVYGVSFLIVLVNTTLYILVLFFCKAKWIGHIVSFNVMISSCLITLFLVITTICYGYKRIFILLEDLPNASHLKIGIVQGNIDQSIKWNSSFQRGTAKKYINLSKLLSFDNLDLIVWPETAIPFYFNSNSELTRFIINSIKEIKSDFIIGSTSKCIEDNGFCYYNSAYLVNSEGKVKGRYDKSVLVPFGEYVPLEKIFSRLPFFKNIFPKISGFKPAVSRDLLLWQQKCTKLGLQICYEIIFPRLSRELSKNGAELLINITNDAWFGYTSAPYQHFAMSVFRAIENRKSLIRAANTGISAFVDPIGNILYRTSIFNNELLVGTVPVYNVITVYTRFGSIFIIICFLVVTINFFLRSQKNNFN